MKILNLLAYSKSGYEQNIGDLFTSIALKKYLQKPQDKWANGCFNQKKKLNLNRFDLIILGGGGLYHPGHLTDLARNTNLYQSTTPLAIIGLGLNLENGQKPTSHFKSQIIQLNQRAFLSTSRDKLTYQFLKNLNIKTPVTGCPSLFLPDLYPHISKTKKTYHLGLNFALHHTAHYQTQQTQILRFINQSSKPLPGKKLIICHAQKEKAYFKTLFPQTKIFFSTKPQKVFQAYTSCQLILGMRGHSQIFAQAVQTPSLALSLNPKVTQPLIMAHSQPQNLTLSLNDSLTRVNQKIDYLQQHYQALVKDQKQLKAKLKKEFLKIVKIIHEDRRFS